MLRMLAFEVKTFFYYNIDSRDNKRKSRAKGPVEVKREQQGK